MANAQQIVKLRDQLSNATSMLDAGMQQDADLSTVLALTLELGLGHDWLAKIDFANRR